MNGSFLTIDEAKMLIKTKEHLYQAMIRNQWYLPKFKSSIITQDFLKKVREGQIWCPKYSDIKLLPCPDPPNKEYLINEVLRASTAQNLHLGIELGKEPDLTWIINVLAFFKKEHEIFQKDYLPPIQVKQKKEKVIDNSDSFFTNLPLLYKRRDLKSKSKLKEYQVSREEELIKHLKEEKVKIEKKILQSVGRVKLIEKKKNVVKVDKDELSKLKQKVQALEKEAQKKKKGRTPMKGEQMIE